MFQNFGIKKKSKLLEKKYFSQFFCTINKFLMQTLPYNAQVFLVDFINLFQYLET